MKTSAALLLFMAMAACAFPARAEDPSIDTAIGILEKQIARDEQIVSRPANIAATRQARQQLRDGLNESQFVIDHFQRHFGETDPKMMRELERIYGEEKAEAGNERYSHRNLESTRDMVLKNLPMKKTILKQARDQTYGQ